MMQLLFLAARAVGFSPCLSKSRACATYLHNTDTPELLWMVGGNVNSTWKTVQQYGGSSNIKKRTCIGSQSLTSDYIPKGSRISIFFKIFIYLTPMGLSCGSQDLFHIMQALSSWQGALEYACSVFAVPGLSCSAACHFLYPQPRIEQGLSPLCCKAGS